jgi:hypothetical protein
MSSFKNHSADWWAGGSIRQQPQIALSVQSCAEDESPYFQRQQNMGAHIWHVGASKEKPACFIQLMK